MKRWEWLSKIVIKNGFTFGAELGVKEGRTLFFLLDSCPTLHMIGVDIWEPQPGPYAIYPHQVYEDKVRRKAEAYSGRVTLIKAWTHEAATSVPDRSLDFVFIDADHSTESVIKDISDWKPKLRLGGILCGHDGNKSSVRNALDTALDKWRLCRNSQNCWIDESPTRQGS